MHLNNVEYQRQQQVHELAQEPPHLDASEAARALAVAAIAALMGSVGALVAGVSLPWHSTWHPWHVAGVMFGGTLLVGWLFALAFVYHHAERWRADLRYERERREAVLESHWNAQGMSTTEIVSETTITTENAGLVVLAALALHQRRHDPARPYSVRSLQKPLFLTLNPRAFDGKRQIRIGQAASESEAQKLADLYARCGLIEGRREKAAGTWTPETIADVIYKLLPEYTQ